MLRSIQLRNFKSWRNLSVRLAPITALFGTNSSGKSSILQLLLLLKQTKDATDRSLALDLGGRNSYANLGTFHDIIFAHDEERHLSWRLDWTLDDEFNVLDPATPRASALFTGRDMSISAVVSRREQQLATDEIAYTLNNQCFKLTRKESRPSAFSLTTQGPNSQFRFVRRPGRVWDIPGPDKSYAFPEQIKTYHQNADFLSDLQLEYERVMNHLYYLGPLREFPKREYIWSGASPTDVGQRGERVVEAMIAARARNEQRNLGYKKRYLPFDAIVAHWLQELGLIYSFEVREIGDHSNLYRVEVRKGRKTPAVLVTDVGFGVSQFLPVLVLLYYVPERSTVLLEQPEIHLHPSVQSGLADLIINVAKHRQIQVIVESHSEHLLRRLQRRIAEESDELSPEDVAIYFCQLDESESTITPLEIDMYGSILNWPKGFFGDDFGELAAIREAGLKKKLTSK